MRYPSDIEHAVVVEVDYHHVVLHLALDQQLFDHELVVDRENLREELQLQGLAVLQVELGDIEDDDRPETVVPPTKVYCA